MSEGSNVTQRDIKVLSKFLERQNVESFQKLRNFIEKQDKIDAESLCTLKALIDENGLKIAQIASEDETVRDYCDNNVCTIAACTFNSTCSGSACTHAGCAANSGGGVTPPANCTTGRTCGTQSCSSNAGGTCGNAVCSYVSGGHHHDDD